MSEIAFPYRVDARGRSAEVSRERHVRDLIEMVLFTSPGERVMRPNFGANLLQLVFQPTGAEQAAAIQALAQSALQEQLGDVIEVLGVRVSAADGRVDAEVDYLIRATGARGADRFSLGGPGG